MYTSTSDANLLKDIAHGAGKMFLRKHEVGDTGTVGTPGATMDLVLTNDPSKTDDYFNGMVLYMVDDNGKLAYGTIDDWVSATKTITIDSTAMLLVSDGVTVPTFSASGVYDLYILGNRLYFGFASFSFTNSPEMDTFRNDNNDPIRRDSNTNDLMVEGTARNFGGSNFQLIYSMTEYGNQSTGEEYHVGFDVITTDYALELDFTDTQLRNWRLNIFRAQFNPNGATEFAKGYKEIPFVATALLDILRDNNNVSAFSIKQIA